MSRSEYREVGGRRLRRRPGVPLTWEIEGWPGCPSNAWYQFAVFDDAPRGAGSEDAERQLWDALPCPAEPPESEWEVIQVAQRDRNGRTSFPAEFLQSDGTRILIDVQPGFSEAPGYYRWNGSFSDPKLVAETRPVRWLVEE